MTDVERAMTGECFYRHGDECRPPGRPVCECWSEAGGWMPVGGCDSVQARIDKVGVLQAEVRRLNEN